VMEWERHSLRSELAEKGSKVLGQQLRLLPCGEVPAPWQFRPTLQVEAALCPLSGGMSLVLCQDSYGSRHPDSFPLLQVPGALGGLVVETAGGAHILGCPEYGRLLPSLLRDRPKPLGLEAGGTNQGADCRSYPGTRPDSCPQRVGRAQLQLAALDGTAKGRALPRMGGAGAAGRGLSSLFPPVPSVGNGAPIPSPGSNTYLPVPVGTLPTA
jgi:hypothetical protein